MKRTILVVSGIVLLGLLIGIGVVSAQDEPFRGPRKMMRMHRGQSGLEMFERIDQFADDIGLTDDQIAKIKDIRDKDAKKIIDLNAEKEKAEIDLKKLMDDPNAKSSDIEKFAKKVMNQENAIKTAKLETMLKIRDVLTADQRAQVKDLIRSRRKEMREERERNRSERKTGRMQGHKKHNQ